MTDLLALAAELVDIPSVSHSEGPLADHVEGVLLGVPWLTVDRVGDNVVARTTLGRASRLVLAGHLDTVPANGNERAVLDGDVLSGLGACDMKGGVAVLLELARSVSSPAVDVTYVFYAGEEVAATYNGLALLFRERPDLVVADAAVLAEPTGAVVEAGCQGTLRVEISLAGRRAHTARPWMGVNAVHRLGDVLARVASFEGRTPTLDGCTYREALQAVRVEGGVAGNVVPDVATVQLNHRFAPDRTAAEAADWLRSFVGDLLGDGDTFAVVDSAEGAPPGFANPLLRSLVDRTGLEVRAKLGWTDVARFAAAGVPACNLGPGDPTLAHRADEFVTRSEIEAVHASLLALLS